MIGLFDTEKTFFYPSNAEPFLNRKTSLPSAYEVAYSRRAHQRFSLNSVTRVFCPPEIPDELLHSYPALTHALNFLVRGILLRLGLIELLAQIFKAALVQSLILRHGGVQVNHVLQHAVKVFHLGKQLVPFPLQLRDIQRFRPVAC